MATVRAYPWASLEALTAADVTLGRSLRRLAATFDADGRALTAMSELLGAPVGARVTRLEPVAGPPDADALAVALGVDDGGRDAIVCEVEPALAIDATLRVVRRAPPPVTGTAPRDPAADAAAASAFGAVLTKALRRAAGAATMRVTAAGRAGDVIPRVLEDACAVILTVVVDADVYRARILVSRRRVAVAQEQVATRAHLARLGDAVLRVPVVASAAWATAREIAALAVGDAWMPSGGLDTRRVVLAGGAVDRGVTATLEAGDRLVVGNAVEELTMTNATDTILESALDAPVVVRVELGVVEMPAREWASLQSGDVVKLARRVGAPVTLRAGSAEIATGELVDVDGEIGVRITTLVGGGA